MSPHPFDEKISDLTEEVAKSLNSLNMAIDRQMSAIVDLIDRMTASDCVIPDQELDGFSKLKEDFISQAEAIRRTLSEPNGSRTDAHDLHMAAQEAVKTAIQNSINVQNQLFTIAQSVISVAAEMRLTKQ